MNATEQRLCYEIAVKFTAVTERDPKEAGAIAERLRACHCGPCPLHLPEMMEPENLTHMVHDVGGLLTHSREEIEQGIFWPRFAQPVTDEGDHA